MELMIIDAIDSILTELDCKPRELRSISVRQDKDGNYDLDIDLKREAPKIGDIVPMQHWDNSYQMRYTRKVGYRSMRVNVTGKHPDDYFIKIHCSNDRSWILREEALDVLRHITQPAVQPIAVLINGIKGDSLEGRFANSRFIGVTLGESENWTKDSIRCFRIYAEDQALYEDSDK